MISRIMWSMMWFMLEWLQSVVRPSREQIDTSIPDSVRLEKLNDYVYEVCKPPESRMPSLEVVFFHGLQPEFSKRPEVTSWLSRDKSELWLNWLRNENPDIRILVVSYQGDGNEWNWDKDLFCVSEDLTVALTDPAVHVGKDGCPVILVGHCLGGIVIKDVCLTTHRMINGSNLGRDEDIKSFLDNVKGAFFFATPHQGVNHPTWRIPIAMPLQIQTARRNNGFRFLSAQRKWKLAGVAESLPVSTGKFKSLIVTEASTRDDMESYWTTADDHFSICRPESIDSVNYLRLTDFLAQFTAFKDQPRVSGTRGKVFLCGNEGVGKTTLRNSLSKSPSSEGSERQQLRRTRGIEVSYVEEQGVLGAKPLVLALWDLAGQHEYEVLHSTFLPDFGLADGPATFFIIVCNANESQSNDLRSAEMHLLYWLKFISSNSLKNISDDKRRRVMVVLNCFEGDASNHDYNSWKYVLDFLRIRFKGYVDLYEEPFIFDARSPSAVTPLKDKLKKEAGQRLENRKMPEACFTIQEFCNKWAKDHADYPVLSWEDYSRCVSEDRETHEDLRVSSHLLKRATDYLHETGHLILFKKHPWTSSTPDHEAQEDLVILDLESPDHEAQEDLVILDPEWFCKKVVGYVLLPKKMVERGEECLISLLERDGSLPIATLATGNLGNFVPQDKLKEVLGLLSRLGLCYTLNSQPDDIFIPALIQDGGPTGLVSKHDPEAPQQAWVMGFSLVLKDALTTLLPIAPLRRLQADLAERLDIGRRPDCEYRAWKSCITFKFEGMNVLVQYLGGDPRTSTQNRLDVLVWPLTYESDLSLQKRRQVEAAQKTVDIFLNITNTSFPGVELERRIIKPQSVQDSYIDDPARDIRTSVERVTQELQGSQKLNWVVNGVQVRIEEVLSEKDLQRLLLSRGEKLAAGVDTCRK